MSLTSAEAANDADIRRPPYPGFGTFSNFIERLARDGVPAVIDRRFIGGSGANQSLVMAALKFLQLVDDEDRPTPTLHMLADDEERRPAIYRQLVEERYAGVTVLGNRASQGQLDQWFRAQGVNGETARKAQSFMLALAKAGDLELSPFFRPTRPAPSTARKRTSRKRAVDDVTAKQPEPRRHDPNRIHPAIINLLDKIPAPGTPWTKPERDLLVTTFGNLLDLFHPVLELANTDDET